MKRSLVWSEYSTASLSILGSLYMMEASGLLIAMALYKNGDKPLLLVLTGRYSPFFLAGMLGVFVSITCLVALYHKSLSKARWQFWLTVAMNFVTVALLLIVGELSIRLFSSQTPQGVEFANNLLMPRSWNDVVARNRELLQKAPSILQKYRNISYFVPDDLLGWTVGPNRRSTDGLYSSSAEGIRSASPGIAYANRPQSYQIALVGDSFTFGSEVPFEESWGYQLEQDLGSQVQVLNFGVDGYGVDQAYLRYFRDVRQWHPDLVVLGFIDHDLYRSMAVYSFISFPEWSFPFAKPRFIVNRDKLEILNTPLPSPEAILSTNSITDLPFLEYDRGYDPEDWQWRPYHHSYLVRFLLSRFPRRSELGSHVSDEAVKAVNSEIITSFEGLARTEGSIPLVAYFPSRGDLRGDDRSLKDGVLGILHERGIRQEDLTSCLRKFSVSELFLEGRPHYSATGNAEVSRCLRPVILQFLSGKKQGKRARQDSTQKIKVMNP